MHFLLYKRVFLSFIVQVASYFAVYSALPVGNFFCFPVGTFNQTQATEYRLTVKDVVLLDSQFSEENME